LISLAVSDRVRNTVQLTSLENGAQPPQISSRKRSSERSRVSQSWASALTLELLSWLRAELKAGLFVPQRVRRRRSRRRRARSGAEVPTTTDRFAQAVLKLVLELIFKAAFQPSSYGFRPRRRAQDAMAEIPSERSASVCPVLTRAVRWQWISVNPLGAARAPARGGQQPAPPVAQRR
jgi:hypothetical protein